MDTIFAPVSGLQRAGVAVFRVSGPAARTTLAVLAGEGDCPSRVMTRVTLADPVTRKPIDDALAVVFRAPASFTGEDVVEYHTHGSPAVARALLAALASVPGCRLAHPGEFTRRAFENGKLDLTAAEAVADLINAETEAQRLQALAQLGGGLEKLYRGWAERLKTLLAHQEADIEFPDEGLPSGLAERLRAQTERLRADIRQHLDDGRRGERLREGLSVVLLGAPNAGKSSLLNALARRDVAIVSDEAGTTRDVLDVHLDLGGYPVVVSDTAGLRAASSAAEAEGVRRARARADRADIRLVLLDGTAARAADDVLALLDDTAVAVQTKSDLPQRLHHPGALPVSAQTGAGLDVLVARLSQKAAALCTDGAPAPTLTRARHRHLLQETEAALARAAAAELPELAAADLRLGLGRLGMITGSVHLEDVLDSLFRDFCIGK